METHVVTTESDKMPFYGPPHIYQEHWRNPNELVFSVALPHSNMDCSYNQITRMFGVCNLDVEEAYRNNGMGQRLLKESIHMAHNLGARLIYAAIISRESLVAFERVFGADAVEVEERGAFLEQGDLTAPRTRAFLLYKL